MKFAMGVLHIPANVFWGMTIIEFWAAYEGAFPQAGEEEVFEPLSREELTDMMKRFPD